MDKEKLVVFERKINKLNGTVSITIPKQLMRYIDADINDIIHIAGNIGKHGKFIAFWKKDQKK